MTIFFFHTAGAQSLQGIGLYPSSVLRMVALSDFWAQVALASSLAVIAAIAYNRVPPRVPAAELSQIRYDVVNWFENEGYGNLAGNDLYY